MIKKILSVLMILLVSGCALNNTFAATRNLAFEAEAKNTLNDLIAAYSKKDLDHLISFVDLDFSDPRGYTAADLAASFKYDFRNFQNINLYITGIKEQIISNDTLKITLVVEWNRSLTIASSAQMWLSRGTTNFTFIKGQNEKLKLREISGDLFFALADYDGVVILSIGTLDGQEIVVPRRLREGRFIE